MEINRKEILRYLGYGRTEPDVRVTALVEECINELLAASQKNNIYRIFDCHIGESTVNIGQMEIASRNLAKNLAGCEEVVLFAATLGIQADFLQKKYAHLDMSKAVILQAAAAAVIEAYCDECQKKIEMEQEKRNRFLRPRFSPGYGDFSLLHQRDMISLLDCPRKIGLTLTESLMLAPSKSVTAVMGISKENRHCPIQGCEACEKTNCQFRRE